MAWTIDYTNSALKQLRKLDRQRAKRIIDYMDNRIAPREDARSLGKALTGPLVDYGAIGLEIAASFAKFRTKG